LHGSGKDAVKNGGSMKAVVYLDSCFVMNTLVNAMLLYLLRRFLHTGTGLFRIVAAAMLGGAAACIQLLFPFSGLMFRALSAFAAGGGMVLAAFGFRGWRTLFFQVGCLFFITAGIGGMVQLFVSRLSSSFFSEGTGEISVVGILLLAAVASVVMAAAFRRMAERKKRRECMCTTVLFLGDRNVKTQGYFDSGNLLREPVSGKPAFVLEEAFFLRLFPEEEREKIHKSLPEYSLCQALERSGYAGRVRLVPYKSVGTKRGLLNGIAIDTLEVCQGEEKVVVHRPFIAVYCGSLSAGSNEENAYHILLPGDFESLCVRS